MVKQLLENSLNVQEMTTENVDSKYSLGNMFKKGVIYGTTLAMLGGCAGYRVNGVDLKNPAKSKTGWCAENPDTCTALKIGGTLALFGGIA